MALGRGQYLKAWGSVFGPNFRRGVSIPKSQLLPEPTISTQYTIDLPCLRCPLPCSALLELALLCHCLALLGSKDKPKYVLKKRSTRQAEGTTNHTLKNVQRASYEPNNMLKTSLAGQAKDVQSRVMTSQGKTEDKPGTSERQSMTS